MTVHEIEQFVVHRLCALGAFADRIGGTVSQMIAQQMAAGSAKGFLHRRNLDENVRAVSLLCDHFFEASDLPCYARESAQRGRFYLGIYSYCLAFSPAGAIYLNCFVSRSFVIGHALKLRNLRLLLSTLIELNAIAALATIGFRRIPSMGYSIPAAIGMPSTL